MPIPTFDHSLLLSRTIEALYLPKLADPVSSHKTAGAQDEVTSFREVKKLNVLLHLHENVSTSKVSNHSQGHIQGDFFNWASPENVSRLAPPKFA